MDAFLQRWESMTEDQLAKSVMFKVEDQECESRGTFNKAEASLPISLSLRLTSSRFSKDEGVTGIWTNAPIPAGTRFGPIQGAKYSPGKCLFFPKFSKDETKPRQQLVGIFFHEQIPSLGNFVNRKVGNPKKTRPSTVKSREGARLC